VRVFYEICNNLKEYDKLVKCGCIDKKEKMKENMRIKEKDR